jgi:hypothetical protein
LRMMAIMREYGAKWNKYEIGVSVLAKNGTLNISSSTKMYYSFPLFSHYLIFCINPTVPVAAKDCFLANSTRDGRLILSLWGIGSSTLVIVLIVEQCCALCHGCPALRIDDVW